ncbi:MAG: hypothetical protein U1F98_03660 [Verrucomicrobiota bacterium]
MNTPAFKSTRAPVAALLLLAPIIGEVLSGATRLSFIFVLLPEIMVWGCGALLIRETVRRWNGGWTSLLLLGFALAVAEEFIIQQTSIAPLPWIHDGPVYGRVLGVNWPWFLFMLVYEAVWVVVVPVQVCELMFPSRRKEPWLRRGGLWIAGTVFLAGSFIAWFLWTQIARPNSFHAPAYHPPPILVLAGLTAILLLIALAYAVRNRRAAPRRVPAAGPWFLAAAGLLLGLPWYLLMLVIFAPRPDLPLVVPMGLGIGWAGLAVALVRHWARAESWADLQRWALCLGALLAVMLGGFLGSNAWPTVDVVGKIVLNLLALAGMGVLAARISTVGRDSVEPSNETE